MPAVPASRNRRNLTILVFTLFVVMLGYGVVIPILPFYIDQMGAGGTELGLLVSSYAVMRLVCAPVWGSLSDRIGRKPVLMIGICGYAITMIWFGLATQLWMLFAARILSGILSSATAPTTLAYIGDSTAVKDRGGGMGALGAAAGIGTIAGPALGGVLASQALSTPFFLAGGLALLALLLAGLVLPESLPVESRKPSAARRSLLDWKAWGNAVQGPFRLLFLLTFISTSGLMMFGNVFGLYALRRFSYNTEQVGGIFMAAGLVSAATQGLLVGPLTRRLGNGRLITAGMISSALAFGWITQVNNLPGVLAATALLSLCTALQAPSLSSLISSRAGQQQGTTMGLNESFTSLGRIAGPLIAGLLFDANIQAPFLAGGAVMLLGGITAWRGLRGESD
jgi:DHA1 family multidrug resistance protein-like MFS transporter